MIRDVAMTKKKRKEEKIRASSFVLVEAQRIVDGRLTLKRHRRKKSSAGCQETRGWIFQSSDFRRENDSLEIGKLNLNSSTDPFQLLTLIRFSRFFIFTLDPSTLYFCRNSSEIIFPLLDEIQVSIGLSTIFTSRRVNPHMMRILWRWL